MIREKVELVPVLLGPDTTFIWNGSVLILEPHTTFIKTGSDPAIRAGHYIY